MSKRSKKRYHNQARADLEDRIQEREMRDEFWNEMNGKIRTIAPKETIELDEEAAAEGITSRTEQKWYVLDTNLLLSCVNVLYDPDDEHWRMPLNFKPDLSNAHLIIPEVVKDELNHLKEEDTFRGMAAKTALRRLAKLFPNSGRDLNEILYLRKPVSTGIETQTISVLPLHKNFARSLPWVPKQDDNDGWIAATALAAKMIHEGMSVDGSVSMEDVMRFHSGDDDVILLTKDNDLLEKADRYAVSSASYSFELRRPYTGCRELVVPAEMFEKFYNEEYLSREDFEEFFPDEPPLVANEYIIMEPEDDEYPRSYFASAKSFANIARFHKENGMLYPLRFMKSEGVSPANAGIAAYYDALNDDKIKVITVEGERGTGKTYQAVIHAIREVIAGKKARIVLIPSASSKNLLGALPGKKEEKMEPLVATCKSAIEAYLISTPEFKKKREMLRKFGDVDANNNSSHDEDAERQVEPTQKVSKRKKIKFDDFNEDYDVGGFERYPKSTKNKAKKAKEGADVADSSHKTHSNNRSPKMTYAEFLRSQVNYIFGRYFVCYPREEVDGLTFHDAFIIVDEIQRIHDPEALLTILTRSAGTSKMVLCGDTKQIRQVTEEKLKNNGITYAKARYYDIVNTACICLTENMRGGGSEYETEDYEEAYARVAGF